MMQQQLDLFDRAAKQFQSNGKALNEDVLRLQEWLQTQPHLPNMLDEHALRNFLILNKCSIEVAKQKIDKYYSVRTKLPEWVYEMNPKLPYHKEFNEMVYMVDHPQLTDDMYKLMFFKVKGETVSENYDPNNFVRKLLTMVELKLRHDVMYGDIFVVDAKGFTVNVLLKMTPTLIYKIYVALYDGVLSARFKALHLLNVPATGNKIINVLKSFMKPKLSERIYIHSDENVLKKVIPLHLLPIDFEEQGVSLQELEDALEVKYLENQELFDRLDAIRVDESLRPEKLKDDYDLGFHGSFKKIEID